MERIEGDPRIALTVGDPAGVGPELVLRLLGDGALLDALRLVVVGPERLRPAAVAPFEEGGAARASWLATEAPEAPGDWRMGEVQEGCGRAAVAALRAGAELAARGRVDALVTAPVSKAALHLAGERVEGQTELLARWAGATRCEMVGVADRLRVMLLTRHMPLREALARVEPEGIVWRLELFDETLRGMGIAAPRLALAGLNPHAGEGGLLGEEEGRLLEPALARARAAGLDVAGPVPPDSVFLHGSEGRYDGILALYHDQAFIPLKLLSRGRGLTLIAGLPYLRVSPVHGTAFDIAGKGLASDENLRAALRAAAAWAGPWRERMAAGAPRRSP